MGKTSRMERVSSMNAVLILYALGTLLDYFTTKFLTAYGGSEGNPIMAAVILYLGIEWVLIVKILTFIYVYRAVKPFRKAMPKFTFYVIYFAILLQWVAVAINTFWVRVIVELGI